MQELEASAYNAKVKTEKRLYEVQAKQQALQDDIGAQVRACAWCSSHHTHNAQPQAYILTCGSRLTGKASPHDAQFSVC